MVNISLPDFLLDKIEIRGLFSYKHAIIENINQFALIIGQNNSGKSNILKILRSIKLYRDCDSQLITSGFDINNCELKLHFNIQKEKREEIFLQMLAHFNLNQNISIPKIIRIDSINYEPDELFCASTYQIKFRTSGDDIIPYLESVLIGRNNLSILSGLQNYVHDLILQAKGQEGMQYVIKLRREPIRHAEPKQHLDPITSFENRFFFYTFYSIVENFFNSIKYLQDYRNFKEKVLTEFRETSIASDGSNFPHKLYGFINNAPPKLVELNSLINEFYPEIKELHHKIKKQNGVDIMIPQIRELTIPGWRSFNYIGKGLHQLVIILTQLIELNEGDILFIEEPELFLHPKLQKKLLRIIFRYISKIQVFVSSHSPFFLNDQNEYTSYHHVIKQDNYSIVENYSDTALNEILSDLGVFPSDVLMNNGIILVEGDSDVKLFRNLLNSYLIDNNVEILPFKGKHKLHFVMDHHLISNLDAKNFKFLIILDRDEGHQKIFDDISDEEAKKNIILLPVREIENFYLDPVILGEFLKYKYPDKFETVEVEDFIRGKIDESITDELKWISIIKLYLQIQPIHCSYFELRDFVAYPDHENWLKHFCTYFKEKFNQSTFDIEKYEEFFAKAKTTVDNYSFDEKLQRIPGKAIRKNLDKILKAEEITIDWQKIQSLLTKSTKFIDFQSKIEDHFNFQ